MSHLIKQIRQHCRQPQKSKVAFVYYYCYFGHNQDEAAPLLRWLLNQLCRYADFVPDQVYEMYRHGGEPSITELLNAIEDALRYFEVVYVAVDAIDESSPRENILKILRDFVIEPRFGKLPLLASSREYIDIERVMEPISESESMNNPFLREDIRLRVQFMLQSNPAFKRWPQELLDEVRETLATSAKGMYVVVILVCVFSF